MPQAGSQIVSPGLGCITSTMAWISARGVKYWPGPALGVLGVLLQQALVGVALHVGVEGHPLLAVDQVDDQAAQLGRVLNLVLGLAEDERPASRAPCPAPPACGGSGSPARRRPAASRLGQSSPAGMGDGRFQGGCVCSWAIFRNSRNVSCST